MYHTGKNVAVYRTADIRVLESRAAPTLQPPGLMERAGLAAADIARTLTAGRRVLVVAGPGNNGGDAFVVARHLQSWDFAVDVVFAGEHARLPPDATAACNAWRSSGGGIVAEIPSVARWNLVIDGLFGIGLQRELAGRHATLVAAINALGATVLALDVPSGLASDSGRVLGCAVRANHTATFIALKPGLLTADGPDYCGNIHVCDLGLTAGAIAPTQGAVIGSDIVQTALPARRANSHKGQHGSVGIIGGASGMAGAALLAARAALLLGAGRVYAGLLDSNAPRVDPQQPELMLRAACDISTIADLNCLAVGPGLGSSADAQTALRSALAGALPLVLDADALNLIAADVAMQASLRTRSGTNVLTPHPAEAARLLKCSTAEIQNDRVNAAVEIAVRFRSHTVVKGAGSVCASPDGLWFINTSGNPGMAAAGMGDVLTGIIAALIAQGADAQTALLAGVCLHGAAADDLVSGGTGPLGLTAGEVSLAARKMINRRRAI